MRPNLNVQNPDLILSREPVPPPPLAPSADSDWALFLDFDGTLCGYRDDPAAVDLDPAQRVLLQRVGEVLQGALCILSGRSAADLERVFGGLDIICIAEHGAAAGITHDAYFLPQLVAAQSALDRLSGDYPGTWVERKPRSCALHYRRVPQHAECLRTVLHKLGRTLLQLRLLDGNGVFEFTARSADKGTALFAQMQELPFRGRVPLVLGDDVTDEDAFVTAAALGGYGVAVGERHSPAARFHLPDVVAVDRWLQQLAGGAYA